MQRIINNHYNKIYKFRLWQEKAFARLPSSVVEFALPHQIPSQMKGGANEGPSRNNELCPKGTPRRVEVATAPPKLCTSSF